MVPPRLLLLAVAATVAGLSLLTGCGSGSSTSTSTSTTVAVGIIGGSTTSTTVAPTTTTVVPPAPASSADQAADAMVNAWTRGNRAAAAQVAVPSAVAALFAHPYQGQTMVGRGCTTAFPPFTCSYGPNGGGNGALYQFTLAQAPGGRWYVTQVQIEG